MAEQKKQDQKSKQIRVSREVYKDIQRRAKPLVDTPDSVLRKVLGIVPKK